MEIQLSYFMTSFDHFLSKKKGMNSIFECIESAAVSQIVSATLIGSPEIYKESLFFNRLVNLLLSYFCK